MTAAQCMHMYLLLTQPSAGGHDYQMADGCRVVSEFHCRSWRSGWSRSAAVLIRWL